MSRIAPNVLAWTRVDGPPVLASPPSIAGQLTVGATVSVVPGVYTGTVTSRAYQWRGNGLVLPGQTGATLLIGSGLLAEFLSVTEVASNGGRPALPVTSVAVGPVTNPATPGPSLDFSDPNNSQYLPML